MTTTEEPAAPPLPETPAEAEHRQALEFHAARAGCIGASEAGILFGHAPVQGVTPMQLYLRLVSTPEQLAARETKPWMRRGLRLERAVAEEAAQRNGWALAAVAHQRHPDAPLGSSPDFLVLDPADLRATPPIIRPLGLLECKTSREEAGWADPDEQPDGVPGGYNIQCQAQADVGVILPSGERWLPPVVWLAAALRSLDPEDFRVYTITPHAGLQAEIRARAAAFMRDHVDPRRPPEWDGSEAGDALLRLMYPTDERPEPLRLLETGTALHRDMLRLRELRAAKLLTAAEDKKIVQRAKEACGAYPGIVGVGWKFSYKSNKDKVEVDHEAVAQLMARELAKVSGAEAAATVHSAAIIRCTTTGPGDRPFKPTFLD
jgi:predicted phage-related endonuclease